MNDKGGIFLKTNIKTLGYEQLVHPETGKKYSVLMNEIENDDVSDLNKIIFKQIIHSLNLKYKRLEVANWIVDNLDENYCLYMSQRAISMEIGCSLKTVYYTIRELQNGNIIEKIENLGCLGYRINPVLICKEKNLKSIGICYYKK